MNVWVSNQVYYPTGCHEVDKYLMGGVRSGEITQISGDEATGKTQFCHSLTVTVAQMGKKVVYLDTESTFNAERIVNITKTRSPKENPRPVMQLIRVMRVYTVIDLFQVLHALIEESDISVLILDSILGLLAPHFVKLETNPDRDGSDSNSAKKEMFTIIRELTKLLATFRLKNPSLAIVVTNSNSEWFRKTWFNNIGRCLVLSMSEARDRSKKMLSLNLPNRPSSSSSLSSESKVTIRHLEVKKNIDFTMNETLPIFFPVVITDAGFQDFIP
jgi:hypothetical protein